MTYDWDMNLSRPLENLLGANTARIVRRLALVNDDLTGRRIAELAGVPNASASLVLAELATIGLVSAKDAGRARLYRLNRGHVLWQPMEDMLASSDRIELTLASTVRAHVGERATLALFGSFARGEAGVDSDIDVVIVWDNSIDADDKYEIMNALHERITLMTGNRLDIVDLAEADLQRMVDEGDPLVQSWCEDSRTLAGEDLRSRLMVRAAR